MSDHGIKWLLKKMWEGMHVEFIEVATKLTSHITQCHCSDGDTVSSLGRESNSFVHWKFILKIVNTSHYPGKTHQQFSES